MAEPDYCSENVLLYDLRTILYTDHFIFSDTTLYSRI